MPDGVCNPVRDVSYLCRTGFATPSVTFQIVEIAEFNVTDGVANPVQHRI
jgi:hypothetical protein